MNIRVDLTTPIKDGTEVVFRSPVDCSQITGLIVYVTENGNTTSQEFALADAHGNNVGDIDHLFAENVVVKVILDVAHSMAFVQNADTNAYLEGRFADIIDKLCPSFKKTGNVVQCEPVEGSLLTIRTIDEDTTAVVIGKNIYNKANYPMTKNIMIRHVSGAEYTSTSFSATKDFIPIGYIYDEKTPLTISIKHAPNDTVGGNTNAGLAFYDIEKRYISGTSKAQAVVPDGAVFMRFSIDSDFVDEAQIEIGTSVTDYEAYRERTAEGPVAKIPAFKGINNVYSRCNDESFAVTVEGKADPVVMIEKLMQAVFPATISISNEEE